MLWLGTLGGAAAGYAIADIPGALLGGLLGQVLDRQLKLRSWRELRERLGGRRGPDLQSLRFMLLGRVAKCEGRVAEAHIRQAREEMRTLGLEGDELRRAIDAFSKGKLAADELREPLQALRGDRVRVESLIAACWRMAAADGRYGNVERRLIIEWGAWLGLNEAQTVALRPAAKTGGPPSSGGNDAYRQALKLLGIGEESDEQAIKRAYRRQLSRHHPDKLAGAGAAEAEVRRATERTGELHAAYALVRKRRGF